MAVGFMRASAQALTAANGADGVRASDAFDEVIAEPLIPLSAGGKAT
jgi:hypothetical protein